MNNRYKKLIFTIFTTITISLSNSSFTMNNEIKEYYKNIKENLNKKNPFEVLQSNLIIESLLENNNDLDRITNKINKLKSNFFIESQLKDDQSEKSEIKNDKINQCKDLKCVICFENIGLKKIKELKCKHKFHKYCIKKWFKTKQTRHSDFGGIEKYNESCPCCRQKSKYATKIHNQNAIII